MYCCLKNTHLIFIWWVVFDYSFLGYIFLKLLFETHYGWRSVELQPCHPYISPCDWVSCRGSKKWGADTAEGAGHKRDDTSPFNQGQGFWSGWMVIHKLKKIFLSDFNIFNHKYIMFILMRLNIIHINDNRHLWTQRKSEFFFWKKAVNFQTVHFGGTHSTAIVVLLHTWHTQLWCAETTLKSLFFKTLKNEQMNETLS